MVHWRLWVTSIAKPDGLSNAVDTIDTSSISTQYERAMDHIVQGMSIINIKVCQFRLLSVYCTAISLKCSELISP
jgi:hypothetical protein